MERENNGRFKKKTSNSLIEENDEGIMSSFQLPNLMTLFCWFLFVIITIPWFIILLNSNILTKSGYLIKDALGVYTNKLEMDGNPNNNKANIIFGGNKGNDLSGRSNRNTNENPKPNILSSNINSDI